jgi:hypothetical protein
MEALEGRSYGPYPLRVCAEKVAEFVEATSDDPDRWTDFAPPGWAAAALFVVAPRLLTDPDLGEAGTSVIHGEQRFTWTRPIPIESELKVGGIVSRVRQRGGVFFTTFDFEASDSDGALVSGTSTFLMSGTSAPTSAGKNSTGTPSSGPPSAGQPVMLPPPMSRGTNDPIPSSHKGFPGLRSASRADLIRYAAATRDWNPIHWDHQSAVAAGLDTVVVHGLLQASWLLGAASVLSDHPAPIADARFRFRSPMLVGSEGVIAGDISGTEVAARLSCGGQEVVSATMSLR